MKNILIFGMSDNPGGIETYVSNMINEVKNSDIHFDFLTVFDTIADEDKYLNDGHKVFHIVPFLRNPLKHFFQLKQIFKYNKYDAIYMNVMDAGSVFTVIISRFFNLKVVVHSHNSNTNRTSLHKFFKPMLNKFADIKIACGKKAGEFMFDDDFIIIPNAFDFSKYKFSIDDRNEIRNKYYFSDDTLVFITTGRIEEQKNPLFIIDILFEVYKSNKNIKMIYIGDGSLKNEVLEKIDSFEKELNGFKNIFIFLGSIEREQIPKYLSASDIFLLPSLYEGLSISLLEALVNGLYCLVSDKIDGDNKIGNNIEFLDIKNNEVQNFIEKIKSFDNKDLENRKNNDINNSKYDLNYPYFKYYLGEVFEKI